MTTTTSIVLLSVNLVLSVAALCGIFLSKRGGGAGTRDVENIVKGESDYQTRAMQNAMNAGNTALLN